MEVMILPINLVFDFGNMIEMIVEMPKVTATIEKIVKINTFNIKCYFFAFLW